MADSELRTKAETFRAMHAGPPILVLANVWDVASARLVARVPGCRALATTSAGVAAVLGYPDGELVPREEMLAAVARIAAAADLPVTADLEAGYGDPVATAQGALTAGAVGMNLEDGVPGRAELVPLDEQAAHVRAVRAAADRAGIPFVVNARTDVYLAGIGEPETRFDHAVERARAYLTAGADCAFVPGVADAETIGRLVQAIGGPLNVLAVAGTPPVPELERLGVRRVSAGSGPMRAALTLAGEIAADMLGPGTYGSFAERALSHAEVNRLLHRPL